MLGLSSCNPWKKILKQKPSSSSDLISYGQWDVAVSLESMGKQLGALLHRAPTLIEGGDHLVSRVAWCTGAAGDFINEAAQAGAQAFITGEIAERNVHEARELGVHLIAAGHHATERYGVQALGNHLADEFDLDVEFVDVDSPW